MSDNGSPFTAGLVQEWAKVEGILWMFHTPYYPQPNGIVGMANGLKWFLKPQDPKWPDRLWDTVTKVSDRWGVNGCSQLTAFCPNAPTALSWGDFMVWYLLFVCFMPDISPGPVFRKHRDKALGFFPALGFSLLLGRERQRVFPCFLAASHLLAEARKVFLGLWLLLQLFRFFLAQNTKTLPERAPSRCTAAWTPHPSPGETEPHLQKKL